MLVAVAVRVKDEVTLAFVKRARACHELITVALEHEFRADGDLDAVRDVDGDVQPAEELVIDEVAQRIVAYGKDGKQVSHHRVADGDGEFALADEQRRDFFFRGEIRHRVGVRLGDIVCGDRFGGAGADFDVVIHGRVEQVSQSVLYPGGYLGHGHGELGQIEEGQVDVDHVVQIIRRKPTHLCAGFGGEVVYLDRKLRAREVEHIKHQGEVQTQVRRGVTLVGLGYLDDQPVKIAQDGLEDLTEVYGAFRDGELEFHGRAHRDDGIVEREQRYIEVVLRAVHGLGHLGVSAVFVGVDILVRIRCGVILLGDFGLALSDVVGHHFARAAEAQPYAAQREPQIHGADVRAEREIELVDVGVRIVDAQKFAVVLADIAVLPLIGLDIAVAVQLDRMIRPFA